MSLHDRSEALKVGLWFNKHRQHGPQEDKVSLRHIAHAAEDVDGQDAQEIANVLLSTPGGESFRRREFDVLENAVLASFGEAERVLSFLSHYPTLSYTWPLSELISPNEESEADELAALRAAGYNGTYPVSAHVWRGERPDAEKLDALKAANFAATVNLCSENKDGDQDTIEHAEHANGMTTLHIPIVDMMPPTPEQVVELLKYLDDMINRGQRVYVHCEAGKGRTGVMIACIRMGLMGWRVADAQTEAEHFGCSVPDQVAFIQSFGAALAARDDHAAGIALGDYPRERLGAVIPTPGELSMTLADAARVSPS